MYLENNPRKRDHITWNQIFSHLPFGIKIVVFISYSWYIYPYDSGCIIHNESCLPQSHHIQNNALGNVACKISILFLPGRCVWYMDVSCCVTENNTIRGPAPSSLQWRNSERDGITNHRRLDFSLNRLFKHRSKKSPKIRVTCFVRGIHRWPVNSPLKRLVTR